MAKKQPKTKNLTVASAVNKEGFKVKDQVPEGAGVEKIHEDNKDIAARQYLFPLLAKDTQKVRPSRNYPDTIHAAPESEWKRFRANTDFSIPVRKTVTKVIRIRTMSNKEQELGEYIYYLANLQGFMKTYVEGELKVFPNPEARVTDVPFGMQPRITLQPIFKNGVIDGYEDKGQYNYYTQKFEKSSIEEILEDNTQEEGGRLEYILIDTGVTFGGFTKEELGTCKLNRLVYRNSNKLNGTEIKDEDKLK